MTQRYRVKILGHETQTDGKILYEIEIKDENINRIKILKLRYSQFKDIHQELILALNKSNIHVNLPEFPGRKLFGSTNKSEQAVLKREKALLQYLNELLQTQGIGIVHLMKKYYIPDQLQNNGRSTYQELNVKVCIDHYSLIGDTVVYYVKFRDLNSHDEWMYKARYSELRNFHQNLQKIIKNLPQFPKKKLFGMTNINKDEIDKRREDLQKYFNQIFSCQQIINNQQIKQLIQQFIDKLKGLAKQQQDFQAMKKYHNI